MNITKVTHIVENKPTQISSTWLIQTRKDVDYTSATFEDENGNPITPDSITRVGSVYQIAFPQAQAGKAVLTY